jgi:hypothetical protein
MPNMPSAINSATSISALGEKILSISLASLSQSLKKSTTTNSTVDVRLQVTYTHDHAISHLYHIVSAFEGLY